MKPFPDIPDKPMKITAKQQAFLAMVHSLNDRFDVVRAGSAAIPLRHPFWSEREIESAKRVQKDWGIPDTLLPFYGDWHDLICLNVESGTIELFDDSRRRVYLWQSSDEFLNCMESDTRPPSDTSGIIASESWLDF